MTTTLPPILAKARELVDPELRKVVNQLDEDTRKVSEYHFGWIQSDGSPNVPSGKALRPALALLSAQCVVHEEELPAAAGVAVELVHNFSLLHDDLMDGDVARRYRPTAWTVFGRSAALLAGDALLALAMDVLLDNASVESVLAAKSLSAATNKLIAGQSADLAFEHRMDVSLNECLRMTAGKTAALLGCAASIGSIYVGGSREVVARLKVFGTELGMAFQLVDDILGLWGDPEVTGKPVLSDVRARKKSAPVVHALTSGTRAGTRLRELYEQREELTEAQLAEAADMVERAGSRDWARSECEHRFTTALRSLPRDNGDPTAIDSMAELAAFIVRRQR